MILKCIFIFGSSKAKLGYLTWTLNLTNTLLYAQFSKYLLYFYGLYPQKRMLNLHRQIYQQCIFTDVANISFNDTKTSLYVSRIVNKNKVFSVMINVENLKID